MMTQAFYTGISGLKTNSMGIDIVSNNIANISTVGFKKQDYEFASLFNEAMQTQSQKTSVDSAVGLGSQLNTASLNLEIGTMILSDRSTDLALQGEGWFAVNNGIDTLYTRDGSFNFDVDNNLVANDGAYVLGTYGDNIQGNILTGVLDEVPLGNITTQDQLRFPKTLQYPSTPTSHADFFGNIGTVDATRTMSSAVIDGNDVKNDLRLEFTRSAVQPTVGTSWDVVAKVRSLDGETVYDTKTGTISFGSSGNLLSTTLSTIDNNGTSVQINLGTAFEGIVSLDNADITASSLADGTQGGDLVGYGINQNGEVIATFSNGRQSSVGKVAVYHFQNDVGLNRVTGTRFKESDNSGAPIFYQDANGKNIIGTKIRNYTLEGSNVTLTTGLTELIVLQRAYDANSKSVTTADQMIQKALNMDA